MACTTAISRRVSMRCIVFFLVRYDFCRMHKKYLVAWPVQVPALVCLGWLELRFLFWERIVTEECRLGGSGR